LLAGGLEHYIPKVSCGQKVQFTRPTDGNRRDVRQEGQPCSTSAA